MDTAQHICVCKQCQKNFSAPSKRFKVCSPECQAVLDAAYVRPPRPTITLVCQHCQQTVTRTAVRYDHGKYCSRPCAYAGRAVTMAADAVKAKALRLEGVRERRAIREAAQALVREAKAKDKALLKALKAVQGRKAYCSICRTERNRNEDPLYAAPVCSYACADTYHARCTEVRRLSPSRKANKVADKARRRMAEQQSVDLISPIAVFERDGWRCYICGVATPRQLRGSNDPYAPELEHVVSLTDGGTHTWANVACACRRCNSAKGAASYHGYEVNLDGPQAVIDPTRAVDALA